MSIRKRFIEMIKNGYPEFDQEKDSVEIEFEGGRHIQRIEKIEIRSIQ